MKTTLNLSELSNVDLLTLIEIRTDEINRIKSMSNPLPFLVGKVKTLKSEIETLKSNLK